MSYLPDTGVSDLLVNLVCTADLLAEISEDQPALFTDAELAFIEAMDELLDLMLEDDEELFTLTDDDTDAEDEA